MTTAAMMQVIHFLKIRVGNPRSEFPRSELLHFLQDSQDFAPVRGHFPGMRRIAGAARPRASDGGGSHGNGSDKFPMKSYPSLWAEAPPHALP